MEILRTPDDRFENLPGWEYAPHYVEVPDGDGGSLRVHYVDEGEGEAVLLLHGEPTWAYLYRKMIPTIVAGGYRAIAVDLPGFGRSDKPAARGDYTYRAHLDWLWAALDQLGVASFNLFCQDWGGLLGLRLAADHPDRFDRIVAANTMLPTGDDEPGPGFTQWRKFSQEVPEFTVGRIVDGGCVSDLSEDLIAAYDAPFPDESYKEGARQFPVIVPISPDDPENAGNRAAWEVLEKWEKPFMTAFGDSDMVLGRAWPALRRIPGTSAREHVTIEAAGHFIQEDKGEEMAALTVDFLDETKP